MFNNYKWLCVPLIMVIYGSRFTNLFKVTFMKTSLAQIQRFIEYFGACVRLHSRCGELCNPLRIGCHIFPRKPFFCCPTSCCFIILYYVLLLWQGQVWNILDITYSYYIQFYCKPTQHLNNDNVRYCNIYDDDVWISIIVIPL